MKDPNFDSKMIIGKRFHAILGLESYKILSSESKKLHVSMTSFIENLLYNYKDNHTTNEVYTTHTQTQIDLLDKLTQLINFNKKFYIDLNATFSNINQIALRLNIAHLEGEGALQEIITQENFHTDTQNILFETKESLLEARKLMLCIINILENDKKNQTRKLKRRNNNELSYQ